MLEVGVHHPVGEALLANTDTLKHTVACQLVHDKASIDCAWSFGLIGHNATDEVRVSGVQGGHQAAQLVL